jgi:hypothetical protein
MNTTTTGQRYATLGFAMQPFLLLVMVGSYFTIRDIFGSLAPDGDAAAAAMSTRPFLPLWIIIAGIGLPLIGLVFLVIADLRYHFRSKWIFWLSAIYGVLALFSFPFGTPFGFALLAYALLRRDVLPSSRFRPSTLLS